MVMIRLVITGYSWPCYGTTLEVVKDCPCHCHLFVLILTNINITVLEVVELIIIDVYGCTVFGVVGRWADFLISISS
jgi:hypothetical protein